MIINESKAFNKIGVERLYSLCFEGNSLVMCYIRHSQKYPVYDITFGNGCKPPWNVICSSCGFKYMNEFFDNRNTMPEVYDEVCDMITQNLVN